MQQAVCHVVQWGSSSTKFDRVEIAFIFSFNSLAETTNGRRRRGNWGALRKMSKTA